MDTADSVLEGRARGWRTLAALHDFIENELEQALATEVDLSTVEYTVLDALSRQDAQHMRMQRLARASALSPSATTRLVNRLEERGLLNRVLCHDDRRGVYTELTAAGHDLLDRARPIHAAALERALAEAGGDPEFAGLVSTLPRLAPTELAH